MSPAYGTPLVRFYNESGSLVAETWATNIASDGTRISASAEPLLWRKAGFGVFGKARPGLMRFSRVGELGSPLTRPRTSFMVDLGGVLELYPGRRTIIRFDIGSDLIRLNERVLRRAGIKLIAPGSAKTALNFSAGVSLRIGPVTSAHEPSADSVRKLELGPLFSTLMLEREFMELRDEPGVGGRLTYNFSKYISLDGQLQLVS